jgi:hypothetical protein
MGNNSRDLYISCPVRKTAEVSISQVLLEKTAETSISHVLLEKKQLRPL